MGDFERVLPDEITRTAIRTPADTEWILRYPEVKQAIKLASSHQIAVLGIEVFRVVEHGLGVDNYSDYEFDLVSDWAAFVTLNNEAALGFIAANVSEVGYGYILTTSSQSESESFARFSRNRLGSGYVYG